MHDHDHPAKLWLTQRLAGSQLLEHYFSLHERGLDASAGADMAGALSSTYAIDRCAFLATVAARWIGREHMVAIRGRGGDLLHAAIAVSPQESGGALRGDAVDILGRFRLADTLAAFQAFGPLVIVVGSLVPDEVFAPGEAAALERVLAGLP